jgi:hypothetical protein
MILFSFWLAELLLMIGQSIFLLEVKEREKMHVVMGF